MDDDTILKGSAGLEHESNVLTLLPGGRPEDDLVVSKIRAILRDAEEGKFDDFLFVGMKKGLDEANVVWPKSTSFRLLGAVWKALRVLSG